MELIKINLGCGPQGKDDWINIDWGILALLHRMPLLEKLLIKFNLFPQGYGVSWPKNLRLYNCQKRLPFDDSSIDYIYTSHLLEHFKKYQAQALICEAHRILKKGGILRVVVPDLKLLATKYIEKDSDYFKKVAGIMDLSRCLGQDNIIMADIFLENFYPLSFKDKPGIISGLMSLFIRPHLWMYDFDSLSKMLKGAGFSNIERKDFKRGDVPDIEYLDKFPEVSLYVEARK